MNKTLLRSLLLGACCAAPIVAFAGGIEVQNCCTPPRVDIPDMSEGWGFYVEGSALRAYNNNLAYDNILTGAVFVADAPVLADGFIFDVPVVNPEFNFGLAVAIDYTLPNSGNIVRLSYEHLFSTEKNDSQSAFPLADPIDDPFFDYDVEGSVKIKLDGAKLVSEQHILIGPYWETTITGGLRYARVEQEFGVGAGFGLDSGNDNDDFDSVDFTDSYASTAKFNGIGPLAGFGAMFHMTENLALGAEFQGALLLGSNKLSMDGGHTVNIGTTATPDFIFVPVDVGTDSQTSIVPEIFTRIYGNYFYRFNDGMELQVELGWRLNQFFNLRTDFNNNSFDDGLADLFLTELPLDLPETISDEIGFSGPYLSAHLKI